MSLSPANVSAFSSVPSLRWSETKGLTALTEQVMVEAPLALEIAYRRGGHEVRKVLGVTMRTPGADEELVLGFLLAEGLIGSLADVTGLMARPENARGEKISTQCVQLARAPDEDLQRISRSLLTSSACGLCGRPSLEGLPLRSATLAGAQDVELRAAILVGLPEKLRRNQPAFFASGGCHGAALATQEGDVLLVREDVGRHNAVDKLFGAALLREISAAGKILVLSGRASFELLQKAAAADVVAVIAVGAPSSAAVQVAHTARITLMGFARDGRFNIYTHADRLDLADGPGLRSFSADENHAPVSVR